MGGRARVAGEAGADDPGAGDPGRTGLTETEREGEGEGEEDEEGGEAGRAEID